ncbi:hypothetical protein AXF42_Ash013016 [Apostasia shenzhenica]|uniref:VAN3-binding protein n=1 Tax=Apostasia shenzhenica TaxID=1088818 RepID=A0A2I0ARX7_9ASPA|nr:hypothetical protein AXF42_Ash013016 [Apostasia shenzhenica]
MAVLPLWLLTEPAFMSSVRLTSYKSQQDATAVKFSSKSPAMEDAGENWLPDMAAGVAARSPEVMQNPLEFLSRAWSASALEVAKALTVAAVTEGDGAIMAEKEEDEAMTGNPFTFACSATSQLVMDRILSQSELSPLTTGRPSHSSGPLNGGSLGDSPPVTPNIGNVVKYYSASNLTKPPAYSGGTRTIGRWLKDRKERKKEVTRARNAELHAAVSVAGVAAAVAAIAAATATATSTSDNRTATSTNDNCTARTNLAVASAATLVAAQCVEAAEALGAEREHLASAVASAVSVRNPSDIATLTAAAATALRGAATLKARVLKDVWNCAAVIPVDRCFPENHHHVECGSASSDELFSEKNILELCSQELLARGFLLLKRTRKGSLHWKIVSAYIHHNGQVTLKIKSRHVGGSITKKKKSIIKGVLKEVPAWPGRHLLEVEGGEERRYFGLKTADERVIEFECRGKREYEIWTKGVSRLLAVAGANRPPAI